MIRFFSKPWRWAAVFSCLLTLSFVWVLLDAFVIPKAQQAVRQPESTAPDQPESTPNISRESTQEASEAASPDLAAPVVTATSYESEQIKISIETVRAHDTTFYVADVQLADAVGLKTALAQDTFGRNIKETTSEMAAANNAILAINGDYYGFRDSGYVLRNGVLYRDVPRGQGDDAALLIDAAGNLHIISESGTDAQELLQSGAQQILSFGPALIENGEIVVSGNTEVSQSKSSNPRTAIGQIGPLHYVFIVSDGRTDESAGLSLLELADELANRGCTVAYNLDGGGSSVMVFNGEIINNPTNGRKSREREVSDIVYIA